MRTLSSQLEQHVGKTVTLQGWVHKKRALGGLMFVLLRDRGGLVQVVVQDEAEQAKLDNLYIGTVIEVAGKVIEEQRAVGGFEIHEPTLSVMVPVTEPPPIEIDKPLDHKPDNLDTLFEYRPLGLRNLQETAIFRLQAAISTALRDHFDEQGFTEIRSPKLLAAATEGGAEVFKIDYFGQEATLAQSPQFYKQIMVGVFERVYEIAPVYRAEPSATTRHMTEYISVDAEMGFININDLKHFLSGLLNHVCHHVWQHHEADLTTWKAERPILTPEIPSLTMAEIHERYSQATGTRTIGEKDLRPDEERFACEYAKTELASEAVFVTDWPASEMKFYHKAQTGNPELADRVDLLFRGVEIVTGSMRENNYEAVLQQLKDKAGGDPEDPGFKPLLVAMRAGMPPHGGFGMGLERLTQKLIGLANVKEASLFPRDMNRLTP